MSMPRRPNEANPYEEFEGTRQWALLNQALDELKNNSDLEEKTSRGHILGCLCKALAADEFAATRAAAQASEDAFARNVIARAQEKMRRANPQHRSLVDELIAERRTESTRA